MPIDQLKNDLTDVIKACPSGPLTSAADLASYMQRELLPAMSLMVDEISEMDDVIESLVHRSDDILHEESATLFAALVESGSKIAAELRGRLAPTDPCHLLIKEFVGIAKEASELLDEITIFEPEVEEDEAVEEPATAPATPGAAS